MSKIDVKTVLMAILASLCGYIFYGYIELSSDFQSYKTSTDKVIESHSSQLLDVWDNHNANIEKQFVMLEKFMSFKEQEATKREELREELLEFKVLYYKEKTER